MNSIHVKCWIQCLAQKRCLILVITIIIITVIYVRSNPKPLACLPSHPPADLCQILHTHILATPYYSLFPKPIVSASMPLHALFSLLSDFPFSWATCKYIPVFQVASRTFFPIFPATMLTELTLCFLMTRFTFYCACFHVCSPSWAITCLRPGTVFYLFISSAYFSPWRRSGTHEYFLSDCMSFSVPLIP